MAQVSSKRQFIYRDAAQWAATTFWARSCLFVAYRLGMVSTMKTTIDIVEPLLDRAKRVAATDGVTLRELVEEGLRLVLDEREKRVPFQLRRASFRGEGLRPNVAGESWQRLRDLIYEGRTS
jgi:hypothetical protein